MDSKTVGVLGGGQLGRMMAEAGHRLGIRLAVVDPGAVTKFYYHSHTISKKRHTFYF